MATYEEIKKKYPNKIPIIMKKADSCNLKPIEKNKFLVATDMTIGRFNFSIRKYFKINGAQSIIFFVNKTLVPVSMSIKEVCHKYGYENDFLVIEYTTENTFG